MGLATTTDSTASLRRAAILLTTLDAAVARRMLDALPPARRAVVRRAMTTLTDVDPLERKRALHDFLVAARRGDSHAADSAPDTLQLQRDGQPHDAAAAAAPTAPGGGGTADAAPLAFLGDVRDDVLLNAVAGEHPQTVAIVLASLAPHQAARLLPRLDASLRHQAMMRLGRLEHLPPDALDSIGEHLRRLLADQQPTAIGGGAGGRSLMAILAELPQDARGSLVQTLDLDPALLQSLDDLHPQSTAAAATPRSHAAGSGLRIAPGTRQRDAASDAGTFDPLAEAQDRDAADDAGDGAERLATEAVGHLLMSLPPQQLRDALAAVEARDALLTLCGLPADAADAVLALLPRRQARQVRKQLQAIGPLRLREIDLAKQQVAAAAGFSRSENARRHAPRVPVAA